MRACKKYGSTSECTYLLPNFQLWCPVRSCLSLVVLNPSVLYRLVHITLADFKFWSQFPHRHTDTAAAQLPTGTGLLLAAPAFLPLPGFLFNFSPRSSLAKILLTLFFWDTQRNKVSNNFTFTQWLVGFPVKFNGLPPLLQGERFHDWSTRWLGWNKMATGCLGALKFKDDLNQPKRCKKILCGPQTIVIFTLHVWLHLFTTRSTSKLSSNTFWASIASTSPKSPGKLHDLETKRRFYQRVLHPGLISTRFHNENFLTRCFLQWARKKRPHGK